jgi:FAD/FMN-containing dehydrogenase
MLVNVEETGSIVPITQESELNEVGRLNASRLELVRAWGRANSGVSHVFRPTTAAGLRAVFEVARENNCSVGLRGGGNSYGDAAMNDENVLVDLCRMNRILDWNPDSGLIRVQPGVTVARLWQYVLQDGWWPPVVTGTMHTTLGGCAAMNVHGKNAWQVGPIGDHIIEFDHMLPSGEIVTCSRDRNSDQFFASIGGFGMLGCFTSITLQLKRVYSGRLRVETQTLPNLAAMFNYFEQNLGSSDYIVGWIDAFASGKALGRGDVHKANYVPDGEDPFPNQTLRLEMQHLPDTILGWLPKSLMWRFMRPLMNNPGTRFVNSGKYWFGRLKGPAELEQPHAAFHFLLDYVPGWKNAYGSGGLIQYQPFIPAENAEIAFGDILRHCQKRGLPNYLSVIKRHRPDEFLMTHSLDGFSLAMDFRVTDRNRHKIAALARELDEIVLQANGRFYFAKDSTLRDEVATSYLGQKTLDEFYRLKRQNDPHNLLQSNLWRRLFG